MDNTRLLTDIKTIYQFRNSDKEICGLYRVTTQSGRIATLFVNGGSVGVLSHVLGEPLTKCINYARIDIKQELLKAIEGLEKE